jgi:hypothetical protein
MIIESAEKQFKIPKTVAPVVCHTIAGEALAGEIFLDVSGRGTPQHLQKFFESDSLFFPIRTPAAEKPVLIARRVLALVELVPFSELVRSDASVMLSEKKGAILEVQGLGAINCEILIDTPAERSRILDVLNDSCRFLSVIRDNIYSLINKSHIFRVIEL